jgi:cytochrome c oxidase assembly protein subunit 15
MSMPSLQSSAPPRRFIDTLRANRIWLHRYALVVVAAIVCLIFFGGQVKSTNSGLSVPDWPNTYDHFMFTFPWEKMVGGIFWEHSHRMIASITGILTFILTLWAYLVEPRRWARRLAMAASLAVLAQGVLGGLTVLFLLPISISAAHGTLAQIYFCLVVTFALVTSKGWKEEVRKEPDSEALPLRKLALATTCIIFAQLIVGAVMRHSEAGLAIPDFPLMFGSLVPPLSDARLAAANSELWKMGLLWKLGISQVTRLQMIEHLLHRLGGLIVFVMVFWTGRRVFKLPTMDRSLRRNAMLLMGLVVVQVSLGILTILTEKQFTITTLHVVTGALTLATSLVLTVRLRHQLYLPHVMPKYSAVVADEVTV